MGVRSEDRTSYPRPLLLLALPGFVVGVPTLAVLRLLNLSMPADSTQVWPVRKNGRTPTIEYTTLVGFAVLAFFLIVGFIGFVLVALFGLAFSAGNADVLGYAGLVFFVLGWVAAGAPLRHRFSINRSVMVFSAIGAVYLMGSAISLLVR